MRTPALAKSAWFRVATASPWIAAADMRLSLIGMTFPVVRIRGSSSAHFKRVSASQGWQWRRATRALNQRSRAVRFLPFRQNKNPEPQSGENHGVYRDVWRICAIPLDDARIGIRLRRPAEDVCVNQVFHNNSVDSELMATKKSLCGQASSQSMAPSFGRAARLTRR